MQFQPVEAGLRGELRAAHEVVADPLHVGAVHGARPVADAVQVLLRRRRDQRPVALRQRLVLALPRHPGRTLGTGVTELQRDLAVGVAMHVVDDALPAVALGLVPQARAARGDARVRCRAGHLGHHHGRAAHGPRAEVHQVVVGRHAVDTGVLGHRRDDDPVLQRDAARAVRREHRRHRLVRLARGAARPGRRSSPRRPPRSSCRAAAGSRG